MNQELVNELRQKADIVEVISSYLPLTKKGRNYFGLCPFHDDTNPSMSISEEKQIYKIYEGFNTLTWRVAYLDNDYMLNILKGNDKKINDEYKYFDGSFERDKFEFRR